MSCKRAHCRIASSYENKPPETYLRLMTRDAIETAVREGIPFVINMADGKSYEVREPFKVALGTARVVVLDDRDLPHILPLLTMTGISYLPKG